MIQMDTVNIHTEDDTWFTYTLITARKQMENR